MAEPDSWEDMDAQPSNPPASAPANSRLNANAPSFSFNINAPAFAPVSNPYYPAPNRPPPQSLYAMNRPPFVGPANPGVPMPYARTPSPVPPYVAPSPAVPCSSPAPPPQTAARNIAPEEPKVETLEKSLDDALGFDANPSGEASTESKSEDVKMEVEDRSVCADVKVMAAADGQSNGYEDQVASELQSLTVKEPKEEPKQEMASNKVDMDLEQVEDIEEQEEEMEKKKHLNVVFIGHVDAGKSTTGGQILFLSNMVDERTIQKYEREAKDKHRESWYMAYIMDTNEEERSKGKTVEVGRAHFETEKSRFTVLDAPGHKNYVPNMISGASQADVGVLVISARKGEFETGFEKGGQTREHAMLAKTLGVSKLLVVVNKMDDPSVQWSKERFDEIEKKITPFLKSCGYNVKKDVQFLPISGLMGTNMKDRVPKSMCSWWDGPCLFEALDAVELPPRDPKGPFRMPIMDKFKDMGTVVMGKVESGTIRLGDSLFVMPNRALVKVVALYQGNDEPRRARPGENIRVKLAGVEEEDVSAGFVLSSVSRPIPSVLEFDAQLQILELLDHKAIFTAGYKAVLHIHSVVEECEIIELLHQIDQKTKKPIKKKTLFVKSGAVVVGRIQVNAPICVEKFSDFPQLGRFTLRDEGKTVAIGKVVKLPTVAGQE
uniref:TSA: Wollemia nobilis Ref_Wollemi_Transcript_5438_2994 transcribed RNA sequence n=1 Tax=Wollemia nobilis TaxID=56998 RepID=A0A0C9QVM4_9CONI